MCLSNLPPIEVTSFCIPNLHHYTPIPPTSQPPDPTANLTFNLTLTEREKEDRSRVVLPYTHTSERKPEHSQVWIQG